MMSQLVFISITVLTTVVFLSIIAIVSKGLAWSKVKRRIDKALSKSHLSQVVILAFLIVFIFLLLVFLSTVTSPIKYEEFWQRFWSALSHFFNPGSFNRGDGIPNVGILLINVFGMILMTGLLISVLSNLLERRVDKLKNGQVHYKYNNHLVIIGYEKMAVSLIKQLAEQYPGRDIILQTVQDVPVVRHELFSYIDKNTERKVTILSGNRNSGEDLEKLSLPDALHIFILGENNEYDHDSLNIECLKKINRILMNKYSKTHFDKPIDETMLKAFLKEEKILNKPCHVFFENQSSYAILQQQDIVGLRHNLEVLNAGKPEHTLVTLLNFLPFNFQELWAKRIFVNNTYCSPDDHTENIQYLPLDREGIDYDSEKTVHLVVLGMSKIGVALGIQATHLCHFPNFLRNKKLKTRITFIDENADREMYFLKGRYAYFFKEIDYYYENIDCPGENFNNLDEPNTKGETEKFTDIEWHFIKGRIEHPKIREELSIYAREGAEHTCLTIAICQNLPATAIASGLYLPKDVYNDNIQILVKQDTSHSILSMLKTTAKYKNVKPFGMLDNCLEQSKTEDYLPMMIDYIYGLYYEKQQVADAIPSYEDMKNKWLGLKVAKKWSNRYNADIISVKQRSFNLQPGIPLNETTTELLAKVEHNRWNIEELLLGFRPTTETEKTEIGTNPYLKDQKKNDFVHNDICPFNNISDMDIENGNKIQNPKEYDYCLSKSIPLILKYLKDEQL